MERGYAREDLSLLRKTRIIEMVVFELSAEASDLLKRTRQVLLATMTARNLASQSIPSWNQIVSWLKGMEGVRRTAA